MLFRVAFQNSFKGNEPDVYLVLDEDFNTLASLGALKNLDMLVGWR